jgi:hypothetical protein
MCYNVALPGHKTTGWLRCQLRALSGSEKVELLSLMQKRAVCKWRMKVLHRCFTPINKVNKVNIDENVQRPRIR